MKKIVLLSLLILLSTSVQALDFFGIEYNGNTADNVINLIYSLIQNDEEQVEICYAQLQETNPSLAEDLKIEDLKIPCYLCKGKGTLAAGKPCPSCNGTGRVSDATALTYLQHKFSTAIDAGKSETAAWKKAKTAFDERRKVVLFKEALSGKIIRKEGDGLLLSLQLSNDVIYVTNLNIMFGRKGTPIKGTVWPNGIYTYRNDDGKPIQIKRYTATLWAD